MPLEMFYYVLTCNVESTQPGGGHSHMVGVADTEIRPAEARGGGGDEGGDCKYVKRNTALKRSLKRVFPSLFQPSLPVTARCASVRAEQNTVPISAWMHLCLLAHAAEALRTFALQPALPVTARCTFAGK